MYYLYYICSIDLKDEVIVGLIHPERISTQMTNCSGDMNSDESVELMMKIVNDLI